MVGWKVTDLLFLAAAAAASLNGGCQISEGKDGSDDDGGGGNVADACSDDDEGTDTLESYNPLRCREEIEGRETWVLNAYGLCLQAAEETFALDVACYAKGSKLTEGMLEAVAKTRMAAGEKCYRLYGLDTCTASSALEGCMMGVLEEVAAGCPLYLGGTGKPASDNLYFCADLTEKANLDVRSADR